MCQAEGGYLGRWGTGIKIVQLVLSTQTWRLNSILGSQALVLKRDKFNKCGEWALLRVHLAKTEQLCEISDWNR